MTLLTKTTLLFFTFCFLCLGNLFAQEKPKVKKVNFGYSINPIVKSKKVDKTKKNSDKVAENSSKEKSIKTTEINKKENNTVAQKTLEIAKKASKANLPPTEIYKIGVGDVLFVSLQNAPSSSKYYTVLNDGTIDYPLAGELVSVQGLTTDEIEEYLREKIKLYENPEVSVKVREYSSHKISVLGLVEKAGDKFLQREAVPLYVIRAQAIVKSNAEKVIIKRKDSDTEEVDLNESKSGDVLIFSGDIVEFVGQEESNDVANSGNFYYIAGEIVDGGQKNFFEGITLYQAILASGGLKDPKIKKVIIRRKDEKGLLKPTTYNIKDIKKGKTPDPQLKSGDTIEVG